MINYSNNYYTIISDKRSVPFNKPLTGTIAINGDVVTGVGTFFKTELPVGSWVVDLPNWELRRVSAVDSDTQVHLFQPFSNNTAAGSIGQAIYSKDAKAKEISLEILATNSPGLLFNSSFSGIMTITKSSSDRSAIDDCIDPQIVDATGTQMKVLILY